MTKFTVAVALMALLVLTLAPAAAAPPARVFWTGKDEDGWRFSFNNTFGNRWTLRMTDPQGKSVSGTCKEVARNEDFIELEDAGNVGDLARLYKNKLFFMSRRG